MKWEEIREQLERYAGEPHAKLLPVLSLLTDLNDDMMNMRHRDFIRANIEEIRVALGVLAGSYEP